MTYYNLEDCIHYMYDNEDINIDTWSKENFYPQAEKHLQELLFKLQSNKQLTKEEYTFIIFMYKYKLKIYNLMCNKKDAVEFYSNFYRNIDTFTAYKAYLSLDTKQDNYLSLIKTTLKSSINTFKNAKKWMIEKGYIII